MKKIILIGICLMLFSTTAIASNDYIFGNTYEYLGTSPENPPVTYLMVSWYDGKAEPTIQYHLLTSKFRCEFNSTVISISASPFIVEPSIDGIDSFCILFDSEMNILGVTEIIDVRQHYATTIQYMIWNCSNRETDTINITVGDYYIGIFGYLPDNYLEYTSATTFLGITQIYTDFNCSSPFTQTGNFNNFYSMGNENPCDLSSIDFTLQYYGEVLPTIWCNCKVDTSNIVSSPLNIYLHENITNATGTHSYIINDTGYVVNATYTGNISNSSFDPNSTEVWLYLGAMLSIENSQFYLLVLISLWAFFIFLYEEKQKNIYSLCIVFLGIPLGIIMSGIAFYNSYPFGYLISFIIILISFLIPAYNQYKGKKK